MYLLNIYNLILTPVDNIITMRRSNYSYAQKTNICPKDNLFVLTWQAVSILYLEWQYIVLYIFIICIKCTLYIDYGRNGLMNSSFDTVCLIEQNHWAC